MAIFDDRKRAFEERFKHEQDLQFKTTARGNRLFGTWAAARLGLSATETKDYATSVVHAQFDKPGVVAKVDDDFRRKGIGTTAVELRSKLALFVEEARRQIMSE